MNFLLKIKKRFWRLCGKNTKPLPEILTIFDSLTGGAMVELKGIAGGPLMLRNRAVALFVAGLLAFAPLSALAAPPPDPCAPDVMTDLTNSAQTGFNNLNSLVTDLMKPPQSAASLPCMRDLFNIWDTDLLSGPAGILTSLGGVFSSMISSIFPFSSLLPGITLTEASPYKLILGAINTMLSS
jgi:hypothetical protein